MAKHTKASLLAAALTARGYREVAGKTKKYRTFAKDGFFSYYVGPYGALRKGLNVSDSTSLTDTRAHETFLIEGEAALAGSDLSTEDGVLVVGWRARCKGYEAVGTIKRISRAEGTLQIEYSDMPGVLVKYEVGAVDVAYASSHS